MLATLGLWLVATSLSTSGTYPPAPPRLRSDITASIDPATYNQGKSIYSGRADLSTLRTASGTARDELRATLASVIKRIPARAQQRLDIEILTQSLDKTSSDALLYYLRLRFRLPEVSA